MDRTEDSNPSGSVRTSFTKEPDSEPIPGYRLLAPLGRGGFGEVWKCEAPGGLIKAIKFVEGDRAGLDGQGAPAAEEWQAVQHIKAIRHPFLLSMERVEITGGELIIVMELADKSLQDLLEEYRQSGLSGIPRAELVGYLVEAAEALDLMNVQHGLQHLDIKPRNLFLVSSHVKVADFGLVNSVCRQGGLRLGAVTPLYASPETFHGNLSPQSDQYSLAIVYQELLTGRLPFTGKNSRQLLVQHTAAEPDLSPLPETDRPIVARALAKEPGLRFPSCRAFVQALMAGTASATSPSHDAGTAHEVDLALRETRKGGDAGARDVLPPGCEALAGCRVLEALNRSPLTETWKVQVPDGRTRLVKVIYGFARNADHGEEAVLETIRSLRHAALIPLEVVQGVPGRLVLITDLPAKTLRDRLVECQGQNLPGIPRTELLRYLRHAARTLHDVCEKQGLQHLGLTPRHLVLDSGRVRLADYGLIALLWYPAGEEVGRLNSRYAAPELFEKQIGPNCDQYSLALIWCELLTGMTVPGAGRGRTLPDLSRLPEGDRPVIARALDADPEKRWPSCLDLLAALQTAGDTRETAADPNDPLWALNQLLAELTAAAEAAPEGEADAPQPAAGKGLHARFSATLPAGTDRTRLEALRQQWNGLLMLDQEGLYVFRVSVPSNFWQRCIGRQPGLKVQIRLSRPQVPGATATEVTVQVRPHGCAPGQSEQLLRQTGPLVLDSARTCLGANPRRRSQERLAWHFPLRVRPVLDDGELGEPVECQGKDISAGGIGFYLPKALPTAQVCVELPPTGQTPGVSLPASIVRVQHCGDSWYEVGALFTPPTLRLMMRSDPEMVLQSAAGASR